MKNLQSACKLLAKRLQTAVPWSPAISLIPMHFFNHIYYVHIFFRPLRPFHSPNTLKNNRSTFVAIDLSQTGATIVGYKMADSNFRGQLYVGNAFATFGGVGFCDDLSLNTDAVPGAALLPVACLQCVLRVSI